MNKIIQKLLSLLLIATLTTCLPLSIFAEDESGKSAEKPICVLVGTDEVSFDGGPAPMIEAGTGRTLVPLRAVLEKMGCTVTYIEATQNIVIFSDITTLSLMINNPTITRSDLLRGIEYFPIDATSTDVFPKIIADRTMLPIRAVAEALWANVSWVEDENNHTITITPTHKKTLCKNGNYAIISRGGNACVIDRSTQKQLLELAIDQGYTKIDDMLNSTDGYPVVLKAYKADSTYDVFSINKEAAVKKYNTVISLRATENENVLLRDTDNKYQLFPFAEATEGEIPPLTLNGAKFQWNDSDKTFSVSGTNCIDLDNLKLKNWVEIDATTYEAIDADKESKLKITYTDSTWQVEPAESEQSDPTTTLELNKENSDTAK